MTMTGETKEKKKKKKGTSLEDIYMRKNLVELIELEKVPTGSPKKLALLMGMAYSYGQGDALAGAMLGRLCYDPKNREAILKMHAELTGVKKPFSVGPMLFLNILVGLGKKYICFRYVERGQDLRVKKVFEKAKAEIIAKMEAKKDAKEGIKEVG